MIEDAEDYKAGVTIRGRKSNGTISHNFKMFCSLRCRCVSEKRSEKNMVPGFWGAFQAVM